jgi:exopolysaccharide biosynthesis polyprenyl glycosylphosphotransferase
LFWVTGWFIMHVVIGVELIGSITYGQTSYGLYLFGLFLVLLIRMGNQQEDFEIKTPPGRWLNAFSQSNKDILVLLTVLFAIVFITKDKGISRVFLSTYIASLWPTLVLIRRFFPGLLTGFLFGKNQRFRTILIGRPEKERAVASFVEDLPKLGLEVAGWVSLDNRSTTDSRLPVLGDLSQLESILDQYKVDQVIILESQKSKDWFKKLFRICDLSGCHVMVYNLWQEYFDQPVHFTRHGVHTFFTLQDEPLQNPVNRIIKRLLDIAISLPIIVFVLPPLCLWVKIMQKRQAPGPLFFLQYRSGFQKKQFKIFKFRSMYTEKDPSKEAIQATRSDNRIYPFGALMRKRSIDEFPQFINVLKGDMSVVGPRPHLLEHDSIFGEVVGTYQIRHFVKPGLTGLAQINGFRGEVVNEKAIQLRVKLDIAYINSWSIGQDAEIILKTVSELFSPSDTAY